MGSIVSFTGAAICAQIVIVSTQVEETNFFHIKKITIGEVLTYLMYMQILTRNVGTMLGEVGNLGKVQGATVAIAEIIYAPIAVNPVGKEKPRNIVGDKDIQISVDDVCFAFPTKKDVPVLHEISLEVPRNHLVALCGASGCGKSTIISLIERYYDPVIGSFSYNGVDLKDIDNTWYH